MKTVVSAANTNINNSTTSQVASIVPKTEPVANEEGMQFQPPNSSTPNSSNVNKRPVSLDLNKSTAKKRSLIPPLLIGSPDLQSMNKTLNTPDLEKIILSSNIMQTPQPGTVFPTKVGPVTTEQEEFGKGFEDALHSLHTSKNSQALLNVSTANNTPTNSAATNNNLTGVNTGMSGGSFTYTNMENFPVIKDEPQNANTSPPVSPIDMETQEKIKLERKRMRNRVAASKCRKRKLERISKLEDKVKILKGENCDLALVVKNLKDHVAQLKQQVIEHVDAGCNVTSICNGAQMLQGK